MKTNEIVREYFNGRRDFGHWAKIAYNLSKEGKSEECIRKVLQEASAATLQMRQNSVPIQFCGDLGIDFDESVLDQIYTAAKTPVAVKAAIMPDAHQGYALPIGGVIVLNRAISPSYVGYDIGCRMHCSIIDMPVEELEEKIQHVCKELQESTSFGVGSGFKTYCDHPVMDHEYWHDPIPSRFKLLAHQQLGSSGGGNHFADVMVGRFLHSDNYWVALLTHSGSRGTGHKIATHFSNEAEQYTKGVAIGVPKGYSWLDIDSDLGQQYIRAMTLMGEYAKANHEIIHEKFVSRLGVEVTAVIQNHHNFAWIEGDDVIHRKGSTPANSTELGVIPGSMGTTSYIVRGLGNETFLNSASHGAGRLFSRTKAKELFDESAYNELLRKKNILTVGVTADESSQAYKDIDHVIDVQVKNKQINVIAKMFPRIVVMGGPSDDGD